MIKLTAILQEVVDDASLKNAFGELVKDIKGDIEDAQDQTNESVLVVAAVGLAVPSIVNSISKVVGIIAKKSGIDLKKRNNPAWYTVLEKVSGKINDYLDTPFNIVLKPFIQDQTKRNKVAGVLKAATLVTMSLMGGVVDFTSIKNAISSLAGEFAQELTVQTLPELTKNLKTIIQTILK